MRALRSTLLTAVAGVTLAGCADNLPVQPAATAPVAPAVSSGPTFSSYIVVLRNSVQIRGAVTGSSFGALMASRSGAPSASALPGVITNTVPSLNAVVVSGVKDATLLASAGDVVAVIPNFEHNIIDPAPEDGLGSILEGDPAQAPQGTDQSGAFFYGLNYQWDMKRMQANRAWVPSRGGLGAKVCIVDSGIDAGHNAFTGKSITSTSMLTGSAAQLDSNFHGSHVAGTVSTNGFGSASVAPNASLMTAKVFNAAGGGATTDVVLNAVAWCADNGADVINMSLGFTGGVPIAGFEDFIAYYQAGLDYATNKGVLIVAAAGNDGMTLPVAGRVFMPAELNGVLSVAATGPNQPIPFTSTSPSWQAPDARFDGIASYSNVGPVPSVDVSAPGGNQPTAAYPSQSLIISVCSRQAGRFSGTTWVPRGCTGGSFIFSAGTSMSSPHVAGLAAVVRGRWPSAVRSPALRTRIESCIFKTVDNVGSTSIFGRGRVNAYRAATTPC